jgi:protein-L-isoaspartate(D-aspartate) O-methyltransferase
LVEVDIYKIKHFNIRKIMLKSNRERLIHNLIHDGHIKSENVKNAFLDVPRENFIPENKKMYAYSDRPLEIGNGQTISAPHMVAIICEALDIQKGEKILEIGAGSGYHAAIVSKLIGKNGHIYTIERFEKLAKFAEKNLKMTGIKNVTVTTGDGSMGLERYSPYDKIYVTCAAPKIPNPLIEQLKDGGLLLIPVGSLYCDLQLIEKKSGKTNIKDLGACVFVPLIGKYGH